MAGSADLQYPCGFYYRRLSLALGKFIGLHPVGIDTSKPLPVFIKYCDLPVLVLSSSIFSELGALA